MDSQSAIKLPFNLKIVPINDTGFPIGIPFLAMFNPENFTIHEDIEWQANCPPGTQGSDTRYVRTKPRTFTLEFMLDGTGVNTNGAKIPVTAQILLFRAATTGVRGALHRSAFLLVQYGTFICTCVLNSSNVTYTMFDMFGLPIRAKVSASFTERTVQTLSSILGMFSSPDLTHRKKVVEGDLLPLMTYQTYKDQTYYLQVAKVNRLKNFRKLKAETTLVFPPISDKTK
ncbi:MAG TPA: hypothetical protein VJ508_10650 [Saprospiraceae bacterium]|nr:hypothetical protein [Saprospiraceae bacterium]